MPSFTVTAANPSLDFSASVRSGLFDLRVVNQSGFTLTARMQVEAQGNPPGLKAELVTADGKPLDSQSPEAELKANDSASYRLRITADPKLEPGTYSFLVKAVNTANTDGDVGLGPTLGVTIPRLVKPPLPAWLAFAIVGALVVIGITVTVVLALRPKQLPTLAMPKLTGLDLDDAVRALQTAALRLGTTGQEKSASAPDGSVLRQDPAPESEVEVGTVVDLVLAQHPPATPPAQVKIEAPNVTGQHFDQASQTLARAGLRFASAIGGADPKQADGLVLRQTPTPGTLVDRGGVITLSLNRPRQIELDQVRREQLLLQYNKSMDAGTIRRLNGATVAPAPGSAPVLKP